MRISILRRALPTCALGCAVLAFPAAAQSDSAPSDTARGVEISGYLPRDHWAVQMAERADELGYLSVYHPSQSAVPLAEVGAALREASRTGGQSFRSVYDRFVEEFAVERSASAGFNLGIHTASLEAGYRRGDGISAPGTGQFPPNRTGALPLPDVDGIVGTGSISVFGGPFSFQLSTEVDSEGLDLGIADLRLSAGAFSVSAGRQVVAYGWSDRGGIVASGQVALDRIEVATDHGLDLPGWLGRIGPVTFNTSLSRLPDDRHPGRPFFWLARAGFRPHSRIDLAIQRASMFGGDSADLPVTLRNVSRMLIGSLEGRTFENQIVSVAGRFRVPSESILPLTAYFEWGAEDAAGAWWDVPGYVVGLRAPSVPGIEGWSIGVEYASFATACCGNPPWYRHFAFPGAWAGEEHTLGHPLGGNGSEVSLNTLLLLDDSRLRLRLSGFRAERRDENLFTPGRGGAYNGFEGELAWRARSNWDAVVRGSLEDGGEWRESLFEIGAKAFAN